MFVFSRKKIFAFIFIIFIALTSYAIFVFFQDTPRNLNFTQKTISINDNGLFFATTASAKTVNDFLKETNLKLNEYDEIIPTENSTVYPGMQVNIRRATKIRVSVDGQTKNFFTLTKTVGNAIIDSRISLGEDDLVNPKQSVLLQNDLQISITRVDIKEETLQKPIDFKIIPEEDDSLGWRIKKIKQKGEKGIKEIRYKVVSHDDKENSRKVLEENIIQKPTPEIIVQGTYIKLGKAAKGDASYYASGWGELNASRSIPRGGFAKVTNLDNGKSVVVKINDYGPRSPALIIDLSYASFSKIGDLGQGILHNIKVEQVLN